MSDEHAHSHGSSRTGLIAAIAAGAILLLGWISDLFPGVPQAAVAGSYWVAFGIGAAFTGREMFESIRHGKFEIDFLMFVAALGATAIGEVGDAALLLFLFNLGHSLENYAMGRAKAAIESLSELAPTTAIVRREGFEEEVPVEDLEVGDLVLVKSNSRIAADGVVVEGESAVDQSPVTGESVPADKSPADADADPDQLPSSAKVFAGTINGAGSLVIQVLKRAKDSTLARVVQLVTEAEAQKSPTQLFTDRFQKIFVPAVIGLVVLLTFAWTVIDEPFGASFYRAMAVLVAASPCALAIATPSAVLSAVARAGRAGVLVKGGAPLEHLGRLTAIAFDKTGTLTEGRPKLSDVVPARGVEEDELLRVAVAVEKLSDHPLAAAVVRDGSAQIGEGSAIPEAEDFQSVTGRGVRAVVENHPVHIGKDDLFIEVDGTPPPSEITESVDRLEKGGRTTMIVRHGDNYLGVIGLMDTPRENARKMIADLRELGIERMVMISGDNQRVADAVASEVGLDEAHGDLMPEDKVATIKMLDSDGEVAMVGDGVNDAPAMANATVGIAMGAAGSDVALETADVALMGDDLANLPFAVGLSRATSRIIRQNLWFSLGMVALLIPATLFGLPIGPAVALHEGSTLIVVINALRLLRYRPGGGENSNAVGIFFPSPM